ncbi:MAG TPA: PIN domain-containing protein [Chloroflexia bacterium]|nr:PIN domain-containing protein [Chloroflexia bacterium]
MMNGAGSALFVDTNVLIHANVASSPLYNVAQQVILDYGGTGSQLWISRQVLREYLAALTRPQAYTNPIPVANLVPDITRFEAEFQVAEDNFQVTNNLLTLVSQIAIGGKHIHDANIVATMQAYGITRLLTENTVDFKSFSHLITVIPL